MISLGVINITKMLLKRSFKTKATKEEKEKKMAEVKVIAERKEKSLRQLKLNERWFDDVKDEEDRSEEEEEPLLHDKEKVFQEMIEQSKGAVSRQMLEKIYAQMEKEHSKGK